MNVHISSFTEVYTKLDAQEWTIFRSLRRQARLIRPLKCLLDLAGLAAAFALAYLLRFDFAIPHGDTALRVAVELPIVVLLQLGVLRLEGVQKFAWRYVSLTEARAFLNAASYSWFC